MKKITQFLPGLVILALLFGALSISTSTVYADAPDPAVKTTIRSCGINGNGHASAANSEQGQANNHFFVDVELPPMPNKIDGKNHGWSTAWRDYQKANKIALDTACQNALDEATATAALTPGSTLGILDGVLIVIPPVVVPEVESCTQGYYTCQSDSGCCPIGAESSSAGTPTVNLVILPVAGVEQVGSQLTIAVEGQDGEVAAIAGSVPKPMTATVADQTIQVANPAGNLPTGQQLTVLVDEDGTIQVVKTVQIKKNK